MSSKSSESEVHQEKAGEEAIAIAAEEVRAFLVTLRGGAPFLSAFDARLLLNWLDGGVPARVILVALERTADARRAKKARTPLSLRHAARAVDELMSTRLPVIAPGGGLDPLVARLRGSADPLERAAGEALGEVQGQGEALVQAGLRVTRRFLDEAWDRADREALMKQADAELGDLASMLPAEKLGGVREEAAREILRRRHPLLSATALWDTVMG